MNDAVMDFMLENNIPLTRDNYLEVAFMGTPPDVLDAEAEADLPEQFQIWNAEE